MRNKIILSFIIATGLALNSQASEELPLINGIQISSFSGRNPFIPQLPEMKKKRVASKEPDKGSPEIDRRRIDRSTDNNSRDNRRSRTRDRKDSNRNQKLATSNSDLKLSGLIWNSTRPQAIINGQVVEVGDKILETEIIRIHKLGVDVSINGITTTINNEPKEPTDENQ